MPETTLALSDLAGRVGVIVSAADTASTIQDKVANAFQSLATITLSESELTLTKSNREMQLQMLGENGLTPAILNKMTQHFCSGDLSLSEHNDRSFAFALSLANDILKMRIVSMKEKSKAQTEKEKLEKPETWEDRTKKAIPV